MSTPQRLLALVDTPAHPHEPSPRLAAILGRLSKYTRGRLDIAVRYNGVFTLADLCARKRSDLRLWKNVGKKCVRDLEATLTMFGFPLADAPQETGVKAPTPERPVKAQTPAQRIANPVWLRNQIQTIVTACESRIREDQALVDAVNANVTIVTPRVSRALPRIEVHRYWKSQLEAILQGKAPTEDPQSLLDPK